MSLVSQNRAFAFSDFIFLAVSILAGIWFFLSYSTQDPRSAMRGDLDSDSITLKAAEVLNKLGYTTGDLKTSADFEVDRILLDSLQYALGRPASIEHLKDSTDKQVFPYYWQVLFYRPDETGTGRFGGNDSDNRLGVRLSDKGEWIALFNGDNKLPSDKLQRRALQYAFQEDSSRDLWKSVPDSAWDGVLSFDVENGYDVTSQNQPEIEKDESKAHVFSLAELNRLGKYYIQRSSWRPDIFELSNVQVKALGKTRGAELNYQSVEPQFGQQVNLTLTVVPTGALINLDMSYNLPSQSRGPAETWELVKIIIILIFAIFVFITFFLRMRARVVDTKSALVVSIVGGFLISVAVFLHDMEFINLFDGGIDWSEFLEIALKMGIFGAFGSIGFFALASIGDSITRQHWQKKLVCYDYLRQGMLFNRPLGEALLRSVVLMFIMAGLWSLLLWVFPGLYFDLNQTFLVYESVWPPLYLLLNNAWYSLMIILSIFLVLGSQIYARTKNRWVCSIFTVFAVALIAPMQLSFGPVTEQMAVMGIFGLVMTLIYLKWDFLTLLFSHYLFISFILVSTGWIVPSSPDLYVFITFAIILLFIIGWAIFSIIKGKEEQSLPSYVPEYVEELAQEERIKQELQIAREVQQSFLPVRTPDIKDLDIAALCQPAHETGGDYYDFIQLDDHRVALTIGDVSGKGIQAAFYMTFTKGILHALCREIDSPAELLKKANRLFCDNAGKGTFISLVYGIIDLEKKTFTFARAGHNPILHLDARKGELNELQPKGLGLGLTREISFDENIKEVQLSLADGDLLVLYTDGIVEALNEAHQFYGDRRLSRLLTSQKTNTSKEILDVLSNDVSTFIGSAKQHDDMTIMVIKMNSH